MLEGVYGSLLVFVLLTLTVLCLLSFIRCVKGPRISDRVLAINMIGTLTIIMVAVLSILLGEGYLTDVALLYAMVSFLSVVVLCKAYTGIYRHRKHERRVRGEETDEA